jgi:hypothetical protein
MRIIEFIENDMENKELLTIKALQYNELLVKIIKADMWYLDPSVSQEKKDNFELKYRAVMEKIATISGEFDELEITYETEKFNEVIEGIELPQSLKRKDVENWLEDWHKYLREKEKLKVGT